MLSAEVLKKIRLLEIHTRRLLSGMRVGDYNTAQKGLGFEFDQIREYQEGDDIRFIDWNSSSRSNKLLVRQYLEERNRTLILVVDCSASTLFSSSDSLKSDLIAQIAGMLALVAEYGKDAVGLLLCTDEVETYIPPSKGRDHVHGIMKALFQAPIATKKTSLKKALKFLMEHHQKNSMVFIISDFIDEGFENELGVAASRHECIAIRCLDPLEKSLPSLGFITVKDPETDQEMIVDTRKLNKVNAILHSRLEEQNKLFRKYNVDCLEVSTDRDLMADIVRFFRRRMMY